jgi:uncharacterized protein DUF6881
MRYQRVVWLHASPEDPVVLYAEIDDDGWERRKVDEFSDDRLAWADGAHDNLDTGTRLGTVPTPALHEITADHQFGGAAISRAEFEAGWNKALAWSPARDNRGH